MLFTSLSFHGIPLQSIKYDLFDTKKELYITNVECILSKSINVGVILVLTIDM